MLGIESLTIGEISDKVVEIKDSVESLTVSLSADQSSQITFRVSDPGFRMHNAGYFVIRRPVTFGSMSMEVAAVEVEHNPTGDYVTVDARSRGIQKLKRDKGAANFGTISPTQFALQKANDVGLGFFGQTSPAKSAIVRTQNEKTDESTWDVLRKLANDLEYLVFESQGILFFASDKFIIERQSKFDLKIPSDEGDAFYVHDAYIRRSDDDPNGAEFQATLARTNADQIVPGTVVRLTGVEYFKLPMLVTSVEYEAGVPNPVGIGARTQEDPPDVGCETKTFRRGDRGDCVKRIQQAVGALADGIFGPLTEAAVKSFQTANELPATGVVDAATWRAITG